MPKPTSTIISTRGRALATQVEGAAPQQLRERGWDVDELRGVSGLFAARDFDSLAEAMRQAELDFPAGTVVRWSDQPPRRRGGGFIVGHPGLGPGISEPLPALIVWPRYPDGVEAIASSWEELAMLLRERLDWLCELARAEPPAETLRGNAAPSATEINAGLQRALAAIDALEREQRISPEIAGPVNDVRCAAFISPVHQLRWDGFAAGWLDGERAHERAGYPILVGNPMVPAYDGEAHLTYRSGIAEGIAARRGA